MASTKLSDLVRFAFLFCIVSIVIFMHPLNLLSKSNASGCKNNPLETYGNSLYQSKQKKVTIINPESLFESFYQKIALQTTSVKQQDITLSVSGAAEIIKTDSGFYIKASIGSYTLKAGYFKKDKIMWTDSTELNFKQLPEILFSFADTTMVACPKSGMLATTDDITSFGKLEIFSSDKSISNLFTLVAYSMIIVPIENKKYPAIIRGTSSLLTEEMIEKIRECNKNGQIIINDIMVRLPDGSTKKICPILVSLRQ